MSLLIVGMSHRTAPVALLERTSFGPEDLSKALHQLLEDGHVDEALVLSTCNRIEIVAEVERFHGGVNHISALLARRSGLSASELGAHLYVHYEDVAVGHLFSVAAGLDSMVVGESQVLGQLRSAYALARAESAAGRVVHELCQQALRVGKRVHTDTGIDRVGASVVAVALDAAAPVLGADLTGRRAVVVGAGAMGALAGTTMRRRGLTDLVIANRSSANAARLAESLNGRAVEMAALDAELVAADVVLASTGATGIVIAAGVIERAMAARDSRPLVILDLALPRDVDPAAAAVPGVTYIDLDHLRSELEGSQSQHDVSAARAIVEEEVAAFVTRQRSVAVAPTVAALRSYAADVVDAELLRLAGRVPDLGPQDRAEVAQAVRRVVDKLLHAPTVRVKELASVPGGEAYAAVLRELFGLDPDRRDLAEAVALPTEISGEGRA
ncbi:MAG: glutamyl-tRNA reductase [Geodermatophilaceae bacterium]|nr:glutamyl-tRNA reductase [Geodermatophilaceae bacterium]